MIFRYGVNCGKYELRDLNSAQENGRDYIKEREQEILEEKCDFKKVNYYI